MAKVFQKKSLKLIMKYKVAKFSTKLVPNYPFALKADILWKAE